MSIVITKLANGNVEITENGKSRSFTPDIDVFESLSDDRNVELTRVNQDLIKRIPYTEVDNMIRQDGSSVNPSSQNQLYQELRDNFFFDLADGGGEHFPISDLRLVFQEKFIGNGVTTTFQLDGTIFNGAFEEGSWDASKIVVSLNGEIVRSDNFKPTYDLVPNFLGNRINVVSISTTGLVTLSHPVRNGIDVSIFYWYETSNDDIISDYYRPDIVAKMEADNSRIDNKIDAHVSDVNNPHQTSIGNLEQGTLAELNSKISDANVDDENSPRTPTSHASTHLESGSDEIEAANLKTTYSPTNYTPTGTNLQGQLQGIDNALSSPPAVVKEHRHIYFAIENTTDTIINAVNTPVKVAGITTQGFGTSGLTMTDNNRIQNVSGSTKRVEVSAHVSGDKEEGAGSDNFVFYIAQTGAVLTGSKSRTRMNNGQSSNADPYWIGDLADGQYFEIWVENTEAASDLKVSDLSLSVIEL
jgi:hypothetical protein